MDVYVYESALICDACGEALIREYEAGKLYSKPQGPYSDGGGESDCVEHCDRMDYCLNALEFGGVKCGAFLENDLTQAGYKSLKEMLAESDGSDYHKGLHELWRKFYDVDYDVAV